MRLLDARALIHDGIATLVNDADVDHPPYAILSHTWGDEEVLFQDIDLGPNFEVPPVPTNEERATKGYGTRPRRQTQTEISPFSKTFEPFVRHDFAENESQKERTKPKDLCSLCWSWCRSARVPPATNTHVKAGWSKIYNACLQTCSDGLDYIWIDNCCIDKTSSAELSEAINAMFGWYHDSYVCYVWLGDCRWCLSHRAQRGEGRQASHVLDACTKAQIEGCRWLTRGWTLQELLAPYRVTFIDMLWTRSPFPSVCRMICDTAGLPPDLVEDPSWRDPDGRMLQTRSPRNLKRDRLARYNVAERMSWAAGRQTTRPEDRAYALLGLLNVNMPLLYGEGDKAFHRLQRTLLDRSTDDSIFAWEDTDGVMRSGCLLARDPDAFCQWRRKESGLRSDMTNPFERRIYRHAFSADSEGLGITLPLTDDGTGFVSTSAKDNRLRYSTSFAVLSTEIQATLFHGKGCQRLALRLRHWERDGEYILSEVILSADDGNTDPGSRYGVPERRLHPCTRHVDTSNTRRLFILWDSITHWETVNEVVFTLFRP